jgi:type I restriction enzyme M protein
LDIIDELSFQSQDDLFELSHIYEDLLQWMGNDGWNSGEYYTPRPIIKAMIQSLDPQIGQKIYDGAIGSGWFLIEAYEYMKPQAKTTDQLHTLWHKSFYGNEKTPIAYVMGVMNMILHGITNPHINKQNTLTEDIRWYEEKDRFEIIIANPPFGGKEKAQIQANFPIKTTATEMLFMQHFMKKLKTWGKAAILVPEWVLFNTSNAFQKIKESLIQDFNLHSIVSLPAGVFLPYSWVKTNVIFFDKTHATKQIWYYEVDPKRKLTKNKPIKYDELSWWIEQYTKRETTDYSWTVNIEDIKDFDISAKNPAKIKEIIHRDPKDILADIKATDEKIGIEREKLEKLLGL